jgi:chromosome segregation ATPase
MPSSNNNNTNNTEEEEEERLAEASNVCAKGRMYWTQGDAESALKEFERALVILETLLGTFHILTAKTYYWIGFITKHDDTTTTTTTYTTTTTTTTTSEQDDPATVTLTHHPYARALRAFCKTARIRILLLGKSHLSTQEALAAVTWVLEAQNKSPEYIQDYLSNLQESLRLETQGDASLRQRAYTDAVTYYQQAMQTFPDPDHATIMGKRAFAYRGQGDLGDAVLWYRAALKVFCTSLQGTHHTDVKTTAERLGEVLAEYKQFDVATIQRYQSNQVVVASVLFEHAGEVARDEGKFRKARTNFLQAVQLEQSILGPDHAVVKHLREHVSRLELLQSHTNVEQSMAALHTKCQRLQDELQAQQKAAATRMRMSIDQHQGNTVSTNDSAEVLEELKAYKDRAETAEANVEQLESTVQQIQQNYAVVAADNRKLQEQLAIEESLHTGSDGGGSMISQDYRSCEEDHLSHSTNSRPSSTRSRDEEEEDQDQHDDNAHPSILKEQLAGKAQELKDFLAEASSVEVVEYQGRDMLLTTSSSSDYVNQIQGELAASQDRVVWLERQCRTLEETVEAHETLVDRLESSQHMQHDLLEQAQEMVQQKTEQAKNWQAQYETLQSEYHRSHEELQDVQGEAKEMRHELSNLFVELKELKASNVEMDGNISRNSDEKESFQEQVTTLELAYSSIKAKLKIANEHIMTLRSVEDGLQSQLKKVESSKDDYETQLQQLRSEKDVLSKQHKETLEQSQQVESAKIKVEALFQDAKSDVAVLQTKFQESQTHANGMEKTWQNELEESRNELKKIKQHEETKRLESLEKQASKDDLLQESQACIFEMKARLEKSAGYVQRLKSEQSISQSQIKELEAAKVVMDLALFNAREQVDSLTSDGGATLEKFTKLEARHLKVEHQLKSSEEDIAKLTTKSEIYKGQVDYLDFAKAEMEQKLEQAETKVKELEGAKETAAAQHGELRSVHEQNDNRLKEAINQKKTLELQAKDLQSELMAVASKNRSLEGKLAEFEYHCAELTKQLEESRKYAQAQRLQVAQADSVKGEMRNELDEAESRLATVEASLKIVGTASQKLAEKSQAMSDRLEKLESEKIVLQAELREAHNAISLSSIDKKSLAADKTQLDSTKKALEEQLGEAQKEALAARQEVQKLTQQLDEIQSIARKMMDEEAQQVKENNDALQKERKISNEELLVFKQKKADIEDNLRSTEMDMDMLRHELLTSSARLQDSEKVRNKVERLLSEAKNRNSELESRLKLTEAAAAALNLMRKASERKLEDSLSKQDEAAQELKEKTSNITMLQSEKASKEEALSALNGDIRERDDIISNMQDEVKALLEQQAILARNVSKLTEEKSELARQLSEAQKSSDSLAEEKVAWDMKVSELDIVNTAMENKLTAVVFEVETLESERSSLKKQLDETLNELRQKENDRKSVCKQLTVAERALKEARENISSLTHSLKARETESELFEATEEAIKSLQFEREALSQEFSDLNASKSFLTSKWEESRIEVARLQNDLASSSKRISELELLKEESEKAKREAVLELQMFDSKKTSVDSRLAEKESRLKMVEARRDTVVIKLTESRNEHAEATLQLEEYKDILIRKEYEIERLQKLVEEEKYLERSRGSSVPAVVSPSNESSASLANEYERVLQKSEEQITTLQKKVYAYQTSMAEDESTILKLRSQNERAIKTITELSVELLALNEKYENVGANYEKLRQLFNALEGKNKILKEQCYLMERRSEEEQQAAAKKLSLLTQTIETLTEEVKQADDTPQQPEAEATTRRLPLVNPEQVGQETCTRLKTSVELSRHIYKTTEAVYTIRRPFKVCMNDEAFSEPIFAISEAYAASAHVKNPASIDAIASIYHDGSQLILSDLATVRHRRSDGSWNDFGNADVRDRPLGWITYTKKDGSEEYYCLGTYTRIVCSSTRQQPRLSVFSRCLSIDIR